MPLTEAYRVGPDGKVIEGWTVLRDPQTGALFDVVAVVSGRMPTPEHNGWRVDGAKERSAINARPHFPTGAA